MKKLIILVLFFSPLAVFADIYPASGSYVISGVSYSTPSAAAAGTCSAHLAPALIAAGYHCGVLSVDGPPNFSATASMLTDTGALYNSYSLGSKFMTCPNGGSVSGSDCVNAPACISPTVRSSSSPYSCFTPAECVYPETDNGSGVCQNWSCPVGQNRNPVTKSCQAPPFCATAQAYDVNTNTCYLKKLNCPGHTHANTANDQCLADAPYVCPSGQHDDGTYSCVADDALGCHGLTQSGYINGIHQCIPKPNLDTVQQAANDSSTSSQLQQASNVGASDLAKSANDSLALDPTNAAKQASADQANNNLQVSVSRSSDLAAKAAQDGLKASNKILDDIDRNVQSGNASEQSRSDQQLVKEATDLTDTNALISQHQSDSLTSTSVTLTDHTITSFSGSGSCPTPISFTAFSKTYSFSFEPECNFANGLRPIILAIASVVALTIISGAI